MALRIRLDFIELIKRHNDIILCQKSAKFLTEKDDNKCSTSFVIQEAWDCPFIFWVGFAEPLSRINYDSSHASSFYKHYKTNAGYGNRRYNT